VRILQLRFKNLNSLAGEWEIDLEAPAFAGERLFAITGPTGAGKSTILDAICLALYGRTPRLGKISKSSNEVMSRRTGECFAEVTFATQAGRFRCHWSQHRARRRAGGELQPPRQEFVDDRSGEVLESKLRGVAQLVEEKTGMDFERFTRSMLLAQGGFAAFLQAAPDERAPILEEITGTDVYSRISVRVHERRSAEQERLRQLDARLQAVELLAPEEEAELRRQLGEEEAAVAELERQRQERAAAVAWLREIEELQRESAEVVAERDAWRREEAEFSEQRLRLQRAQQALEAAADHVALRGKREELERQRSALAEIAEKLPLLETQVQQALETAGTARRRLEELQAEQRAAAPRIRAARELDLRLEAAGEAVAAATKAHAAAEQGLAELAKQRQQAVAEQRRMTQALAAVAQELETHAADETLLTELSAIEERLAALQRLQAAREAAAATGAEAEVEAETAAETLERAEKARDEAQLERQQAETAQREREQRLAELLAGRELAAWRVELAELRQRRHDLERLQERMAELRQAERERLELLPERDQVSAAIARGEEEQRLIEERLAAAELEARRLEEEHARLSRIRDLESERRQLRDREPCPLCGAREHPYATAEPGAPDAAAEALQAGRREVKEISAQLQELRIEQVRRRERARHLDQLLPEREQRVQAVAEAVRGLRAPLGIDWDDAAEGGSTAQLAAQLAAQLESDAETASPLEARSHELTAANQRRLRDAEAMVAACEQLEGDLDAARPELEALRERLSAAELEAQRAADRAAHADRALEAARTALAAAATRLEESSAALAADLAPCGIEPPALAEPEPLRQLLAKRCRNWRAWQKQQRELEQALIAAASAAVVREQRIDKEQSDLGTARERLRRAIAGQQELQQERVESFGDLAPDAEEKRLAVALEQAQTAHQTAREAADKASHEVRRSEERQEELQHLILAVAEQLTQLEEQFLAQLSTLGFSDEADYRNAALPAAERNALRSAAEAMEQRGKQLQLRQQELSRRLAALEARNLTTRPRPELERELTALEQKSEEHQQAIGALGERLQRNREQREAQQSLLRERELQARECDRWEQLHALIGSADGKKFRNFAQGLTFEMVVRYANRQLRRMSDRYLLQRDPHAPLELNVIDNYQAGETRSTKNLSGGESFIVSLALALGLSQMSGQNVRVDSLFLDEGFGSLDADALETALETLATLEQDGKLIGVISHVPALKERISTQIEVIPRSGGRSELSGPGCRRVG
jgi:exonuclease SbcC